MTITYTLINSLDEIDYDDLFQRSLDVITLNWPSDSPLSSDEIKTHLRNMIESGLNEEWPGLNSHSPTDRYIVFKSEELETGLLVGLVAGYITEDGTFEGRHSFSTPDSTGSRNFIYTEQARIARDQLYRDNNISKIKYSTIPEDSSLYRLLKLRANSGNYIILSDEPEVLQPGYRTIITQPNL